MKIILLNNVVGVGKAGEIKEVKDGYARNYLIPMRFAEKATKGKEAVWKKMQAELSKKAVEVLQSSRELKQKIEQLDCTIKVKAGEDGKLFGSVTKGDIADFLNQQGYAIDKKKIIMEHIKTLGEHEVNIRLDEGVTAEITVKVIKE